MSQRGPGGEQYEIRRGLAKSSFLSPDSSTHFHPFLQVCEHLPCQFVWTVTYFKRRDKQDNLY